MHHIKVLLGGASWYIGTGPLPVLATNQTFTIISS